MDYKILNILILSKIDVLTPKFKVIEIFQLIDKILKDKILMSSLEVVEAIT